MKSFFKNSIKKIFSYPLVWNTFGSFFRSHGVIVLMYHRVCYSDGFFPGLDVKVFKKQMEWVKNNCNVIHPDKFGEGVKNNNKYIPNVLITFDDGYQCCYEYAYPILKELSLPALVFLATQPTDDGGMIWTDYLYYLIQSTNETNITIPWNNKNFSLSSIHDKNILLSKMKYYLKNIPNNERKNHLDTLEVIFKVSKNSDIGRQMLSWDEVRNSLDTVCYGGHTHSHPIMSRLDKENLEKEIEICKKRIYSETGLVVKYFAYPNGQPADYNDLCKELLRKHGFEFAFTTVEGVNNIDTNFMEIKRIPTSVHTIENFVWLISAIRG